MDLIIYIIIGLVLYRIGSWIVTRLSYHYRVIQQVEGPRKANLLIWVFVYTYITTNGYLYFSLQQDLIWNSSHRWRQEGINLIPFGKYFNAAKENHFIQYVYAPRDYLPYDIKAIVMSYIAVVVIGIVFLLLLNYRFKSIKKALYIYFPVYYLFFMTTSTEIITGVILIVLGGTIGVFIINVINKTKINIRAEWMLLALICSLFFFIDEYSFSITQKENKIYTIDQQFRFNDQLNINFQELTLNEHLIRIDSIIDFEPLDNIPYGVTTKAFKVEYNLNGEDIYMFNYIDRSEETLSFINYKIDNRKRKVLPFKIYGVSQVFYKVEDEVLLSQFQILEEGWILEAYPCYQYKVKVPKVTEYKSEWEFNVALENDGDIDQLSGLKSGVVSENDKEQIIDLRYFFIDEVDKESIEISLIPKGVRFILDYNVDKNSSIFEFTEENISNAIFTR